MTIRFLAGITGAAAAAVGGWIAYHNSVAEPTLYYKKSSFAEKLIAACPILTEKYFPTPFLVSGHLATIFAATFRSDPVVQYRRETITAGESEKQCCMLKS